MEIMTTLRFPKCRTTSKSVKDLIRQDLDKKTTRLNHKISQLGGYIDDYTAPGSHYTIDDLDILARRATVRKTKLLSDQLKTGPSGTDPDNAAEPQVTGSSAESTTPINDPIRTDMSLDDSFGATMGNIDSQVLSPAQLDNTINELGMKSSYANITKSSPSTNSAALAVKTSAPGTDKRKWNNISSSSISDTSTDSPGLSKISEKILTSI